jgi:phosphonate transport system substrate-binding protein
VIAATACLAASSSCGRTEAPLPSELRVGAIPDQSAELVERQHAALIRVVCGRLKIECRWMPARSYDEVVAQLGRGEVDVAYLGGATFVQAERWHRAVPLVMRDIDSRFTSVVVVREEDVARALADLKGRPFAFGNQRSTSGHFMARHFFRLSGIEPERDFRRIAYSDSHDATIRLVAAGEVDAGVVNASVYYQRLIAGDPIARRLRVLWRSPPFADYVWAARAGLPDRLRERLVDAFLDLDRNVPGHAEALNAEAAGGFVPAYSADFNEVRAIVLEPGATNRSRE